ncbi:hypothetical protein [Dapis sp. BLCC M229]|uniref:hypothetical protein n=1 Tax=Dapis sp. BLCC M229 TaxID=3400188 RepID=UPI003CE71E29
MRKVSGLLLVWKKRKQFHSCGGKNTPYLRYKEKIKHFYFPESVRVKVKINLSESKNVFVSQIFGVLPLTKNTKKSNSFGGKTSSYLQEKQKVKMFHDSEYLEVNV